MEFSILDWVEEDLFNQLTGIGKEKFLDNIADERNKFIYDFFNLAFKDIYLLVFEHLLNEEEDARLRDLMIQHRIEEIQVYRKNQYSFKCSDPDCGVEEVKYLFSRPRRGLLNGYFESLSFCPHGHPLKSIIRDKKGWKTFVKLPQEIRSAFLRSSPSEEVLLKRAGLFNKSQEIDLDKIRFHYPEIPARHFENKEFLLLFLSSYK